MISKKRRLGVPADAPPGFSRALERAWRAGQRYLASLLPNARHLVAKHSGHSVHVEQPAIVVRETARVVSLARASASIP